MPAPVLDAYFETLFDGLLVELLQRPPGATTLRPVLHVHDTADAFEVELAVPGVALEDLAVHYDDGMLTIGGPHLHRSAFLPADVQSDGISFTLRGGVLRVVAPKVPGARPLF